MGCGVSQPVQPELPSQGRPDTGAQAQDDHKDPAPATSQVRIGALTLGSALAEQAPRDLVAGEAEALSCVEALEELLTFTEGDGGDLLTYSSEFNYMVVR